MWSPKGTTLRLIRCPTLQVSQFLFPGQRTDTILTEHVVSLCFSVLVIHSLILSVSQSVG